MLKAEKIFFMGNVYLYMHLLSLTLNSGLHFLKLTFAGTRWHAALWDSRGAFTALKGFTVSFSRKYPGVHCLFPETVPVWIL